MLSPSPTLGAAATSRTRPWSVSNHEDAASAAHVAPMPGHVMAKTKAINHLAAPNLVDLCMTKLRHDRLYRLRPRFPL
jgi:hypothetical protein